MSPYSVRKLSPDRWNKTEESSPERTRQCRDLFCKTRRTVKARTPLPRLLSPAGVSTLVAAGTVISYNLFYQHRHAQDVDIGRPSTKLVVSSQYAEILQVPLIQDAFRDNS